MIRLTTPKICLLLLILFVSGTMTGSLQAQTTYTNKPFAPTENYRTWSIGVHGGLLSQANIFELGREFEELKYNAGYGVYIKKTIFPAFALQLDYVGGKVAGSLGENQFETKLPWSVALSTQFTLANINWRHQDAFLKPYLNLGMGMMGYQPWVYVEEEETIYEKTTGMFIPVGLGAKLRITNGINLDLGYRMNFARSYAFDGVTSEKRDVFSYSHIGLEFALGNKSKPYLGNTNPVAEMSAQYDELVKIMEMQKTDLNQRTATLESENERLKSQIERIYYDFADDDHDGVPNRYDQCPDTPEGVRVDGSGCPLPEAKAPIIQQIVVTEEDRKIVDEAIQNLEFDSSKATIRSTSFPSLNRVALLLIEKNFSLKLAGHTDNTGSMQLNLKLSKDRAESVKAYLVSKGANPSRIEAVGYGPTQPIADNNTEEGKQKNRRVEFTLY